MHQRGAGHFDRKAFVTQDRSRSIVRPSAIRGTTHAKAKTAEK